MFVQTGIETFINAPPRWVSECRIGLLCNPASVNRNFTHSRTLIHHRFPDQLTALFSPQHGFFAEKQDNMIESGDLLDPMLRIPVFSLYGRHRIPTQAMFDEIDLLIIDLQDVGTRVYTFIYTMSYCLERAAEYKKRVLILDRPNPVGGTILEGNLLTPEYASFVGRYPIPMRHGLTIGELGLLFNDHFGIGCRLEVVPMSNWNRAMFFEDTGLPWVPPSPNLPTPASALVYPGQVLWEGTNISEGRGTALPFEMFGAPFLDLEKIERALTDTGLAGAVLRPAAFEPTSNKWAGQLCRGFQIHVTHPELFLPFGLSCRLLQAILSLHKDKFQWKPPPYEYEYERPPIDLILGDGEVRARLESLEDFNLIEAGWRRELEEFKTISSRFLLYD
jgi:uncharacterized protein YbbC (DUF1343 family)